MGGVLSDSETRARSLARVAPGDTLSFGYVDGAGFAVLDDIWTFDHGGPDPLEGWTSLDVTAQTGTYVQQISSATWTVDPYNDVPAPILSGSGSAWIGATGSVARELCFSPGPGYGNKWAQRLVSPMFAHDGESDVTVGWTYFVDSELTFDHTRVYLERLPSGERDEVRAYTGQAGLSGDHPASPPVGVMDGVVLTASSFAGDTEFRIAFEMTSDGSWSDEDGFYETAYGPFGLDDVAVSGFGAGGAGSATYGFESDLEGWTAEPVPGLGTSVGVANVGAYTIQGDCPCSMTGNVLEMHDDQREHPDGQRLYAVSPPVDVLNDVAFAGDGDLLVFADWTQYVELPRANGVFFRPGWQYFPWICDVSGEAGWSPRVGTSTFSFEPGPACLALRDFATAGLDPVPQGIEQVRFLYELYSSCEAFGVTDCSGETNFTPILDDLQVRFTQVPHAPTVSIVDGLQFQDGFSQSAFENDPCLSGRADVTRNVGGFGNTPPFVLGDSLGISGPVVSDLDGRWESDLWFRVARKGPCSEDRARYRDWRDQANLAAGVDIEAGEFARASMDSAQSGTNAWKNRFCSYLKEEDWAAWGRPASGPELSDAVEIIQDDVLYPGTQIEYFVTANYLDTPTDRFLLPDTTGGFFAEFEILPGWREVGGDFKYPCLLYVDAFNGGAQPFLQAAFDSLGYDPDRYDYLDATSSWKAPMARGQSSTSNNGCVLTQLLQYRGVLVNTGSSNVSSILWPEDYTLLSDWLTVVANGGSYTRQGLLLNGDGMALALDADGGALLSRMGASLLGDSYSQLTGNTDACVGIESPSGGPGAYGTVNSAWDYECDAYGNWCPQQLRFDVLGAVGTGVGNRSYLDRDGLMETEYAQIVNENIIPSGDSYLENYRTVLDGVSWHHLVSPDGSGGDRCVPSLENVSRAAFGEIASALEWIYEVDFEQIGFCDPIPISGIDGGVGYGASIRLYPGSPNPFNPRTTIRFHLATSGAAELFVYDVSGRKIRTLSKGIFDAGAHDVVWDGTDDDGRSVASGTYWTRLETMGHRSASRLVRVK